MSSARRCISFASCGSAAAPGQSRLGFCLHRKRHGIAAVPDRSRIQRRSFGLRFFGNSIRRGRLRPHARFLPARSRRRQRFRLGRALLGLGRIECRGFRNVRRRKKSVGFQVEFDFPLRFRADIPALQRRSSEVFIRSRLRRILPGTFRTRFLFSPAAPLAFPFPVLGALLYLRFSHRRIQLFLNRREHLVTFLGILNEVRDIKEGIFFKAYIDKSRLHAWKHLSHLPFIGICQYAAASVPLYVKLSQLVVFHNSDLCFQRRAGNNHFFNHWNAPIWGTRSQTVWREAYTWTHCIKHGSCNVPSLI